jgi:hypothetical protein
MTTTARKDPKIDQNDNKNTTRKDAKIILEHKEQLNITILWQHILSLVIKPYLTNFTKNFTRTLPCPKPRYL